MSTTATTTPLDLSATSLLPNEILLSLQNLTVELYQLSGVNSRISGSALESQPESESQNPINRLLPFAEHLVGQLNQSIDGLVQAIPACSEADPSGGVMLQFSVKVVPRPTNSEHLAELAKAFDQHASYYESSSSSNSSLISISPNSNPQLPKFRQNSAQLDKSHVWCPDPDPYILEDNLYQRRGRKNLDIYLFRPPTAVVTQDLFSKSFYPAVKAYRSQAHILLDYYNIYVLQTIAKHCEHFKMGVPDNLDELDQRLEVLLDEGLVLLGRRIKRCVWQMVHWEPGESKPKITQPENTLEIEQLSNWSPEEEEAKLEAEVGQFEENVESDKEEVTVVMSEPSEATVTILNENSAEDNTMSPELEEPKIEVPEEEEEEVEENLESDKEDEAVDQQESSSIVEAMNCSEESEEEEEEEEIQEESEVQQSIRQFCLRPRPPKRPSTEVAQPSAKRSAKLVSAKTPEDLLTPEELEIAEDIGNMKWTPSAILSDDMRLPELATASDKPRRCFTTQWEDTSFTKEQFQVLMLLKLSEHYASHRFVGGQFIVTWRLTEEWEENFQRNCPVLKRYLDEKRIKDKFEQTRKGSGASRRTSKLRR